MKYASSGRRDQRDVIEGTNWIAEPSVSIASRLEEEREDEGNVGVGMRRKGIRERRVGDLPVAVESSSSRRRAPNRVAECRGPGSVECAARKRHTSDNRDWVGEARRAYHNSRSNSDTHARVADS